MLAHLRGSLLHALDAPRLRRDPLNLDTNNF